MYTRLVLSENPHTPLNFARALQGGEKGFLMTRESTWTFDRGVSVIAMLHQACQRRQHTTPRNTQTQRTLTMWHTGGLKSSKNSTTALNYRQR